MLKVKNSVYATALISSTIIGVGLFSLPYVAFKAGLWLMVGYFFFLGLIAIIIHYFFSEVALRSPDFSRLPGLVGIHLGRKGKNIAFVSTMLGLLGAILAYLIVGGQFLSFLLSPFFGGSNLLYTLIYFAFGAFLIYRGVKAISKIEFFCLILIFLIVAVMVLSSYPFLETKNIPLIGEKGHLFLPYGVILFSLWGASVIPEAEEILGKKKKLLKKVIPISIIIPILIYILFIFFILGIQGENVTPSALGGLKNLLDKRIYFLSLLFGILATFTSFIALGLTLKKVFWYDLKIDKNASWLITCFVPLSLFLIGFKDFIEIIGLVGGIAIGIDAVLISLMYKKIKPKNILVYPLVLVFLAGIIYEIIYFIK